MTKQEALEAIIDICEEAWHVRGSIARAALNASEPRTLETVTGQRIDLAEPWRVPNVGTEGPRRRRKTMSNTPKNPADAGPDLQRAVRPLYYWHEGPNGDCFRVETDEAESDAPCPHCAPRYDQAALDAAVAAERERCVAACAEVMNAYGGDPNGRLLSADRVRMQHQLQASGAAQCIDRIKA